MDMGSRSNTVRNITRDIRGRGRRFTPGIFTLHTSPTIPSQRMHARQKNALEISLKFSLSCLRSLSYHLPIMPQGHAASCTLCFEGEGGADLVGSLVELLGIKGGAEAEGHAGAKEDIVGDGCDTAIVDLDLGE